MSKTFKIILIVIVAPSFLGLGGWNMLQASNNNSSISAIKSEYIALCQTLLRIETMVVSISNKQDESEAKLSEISKCQAVTNQKITDHIYDDNRRTDRLFNKLNRHLERGKHYE